jgi:hypothetical protein
MVNPAHSGSPESSPTMARWRSVFTRFHHPGHENTEPVGEEKFIQLWQNLKDV